MKDTFGKDIRVGDTVAYSTAIGRSAVLKIGRVVSVDGNLKVIGMRRRYGSERCNSRPGTLLYPDERVIVLPDHIVPADWLDKLAEVVS